MMRHIVISAVVLQFAVEARAQDPAPLEPPSFGRAVGLQRDLVVVGAPNADKGSGRAYVFRRNGDEHQLLHVMKPPSAAGRNMFGGSLAISDRVIAIGDSWASTGFTRSAGAAFAYEISKHGMPVGKPQRLVSLDPQQDASFGESLAAHGNVLAVGESTREDGGSVAIFRRTNGAWSRDATLSALKLDTDRLGVASFGSNVAMNQTTLIVGAPFTLVDDQRLGAAFVYTKNNEGRFAAAPVMLGIKGGRPYDMFGGQVAVGEQIIAVSAFLADVEGKEDAGVVCVYARGEDGRFPKQPTTVITAERPIERESFGATLAISGRRLLIGTSESGPIQSGVYVFEPADDDPTGWKQVVRLQSEDARAGFGSWGLAADWPLIYVGEPHSYARSGKNGSVAVIACDVKDGKPSFRRLKSIEMPID